MGEGHPFLRKLPRRRQFLYKPAAFAKRTLEKRTTEKSKVKEKM